MKKSFLVLLLVLLFCFTGCSSDPVEPVGPAKTVITNIEFEADSMDIKVGEEDILPIIYTGNGSVSDIIFTCSKNGIVSINEDFITGISAGVVDITATSPSDSSVFATITVNVLDPASGRKVTLRIGGRTPSLRVNDSMDLNILNMNNTNATSIADFEFTVNDTSIAKIEKNTLTGLKTGSVIVTAVQKSLPTNTGSTTIYIGNDSYTTTTSGEINDGPLIAYFEDNNYTLNAGEPKQIKMIGAVDYQRYRYVTYDETALVVSDTGLVYGLKEGSYVITIRSKDSTEFISTTLNVDVVGTPKVNYIERLLTVALAEQGYTEWTNRNDTKYGEWNTCNYEAWCATFVSWCANNAGIPSDVLYRTISVSVYMTKYQADNLFFFKEDYTPVAGDLIIFKSNGASHVGIVVTSDETTVYTIEGNTSNMVARRSYPLDYNTITGYCHPNYGEYSFSTGIKWE